MDGAKGPPAGRLPRAKPAGSWRWPTVSGVRRSGLGVT